VFGLKLLQKPIPKMMQMTLLFSLLGKCSMSSVFGPTSHYMSAYLMINSALIEIAFSESLKNLNGKELLNWEESGKGSALDKGQFREKRDVLFYLTISRF